MQSKHQRQFQASDNKVHINCDGQLYECNLSSFRTLLERMKQTSRPWSAEDIKGNEQFVRIGTAAIELEEVTPQTVDIFLELMSATQSTSGATAGAHK